MEKGDGRDPKEKRVRMGAIGTANRISDKAVVG